MVGFADEDRPAPKRQHEVGQDLSMLSVAEIDLRIALLDGEIERLREARRHKLASRSAAEAVFGPR